MHVQLLEQVITTGTLYLHFPNKPTRTIGQGEPVGHMHFKNEKALKQVFAQPELTVGESYMQGLWDPGEGGLLALLKLYFSNGGELEKHRWLHLAVRALKPVIKANNVLRARDNVHHHYDIDPDLFAHFLDEDMQYSCAYFEKDDLTLEQAQRAKCRHIGRKLCLSAGQQVLDIGCGWGGMAMYLAQTYDVKVTGLTLSDDQHRIAKERVKKAGLQGQVQILKQDYREHGRDQGSNQYDGIVSVGMFEHVGRPQYPTYFENVARLLKPGGVSLIHSIGQTGPESRGGQAWIDKYIFPGGHIPAFSEVAVPIQDSGLVLSDLEVWRLHYAKTLHTWYERFQKNKELFKQRLGEQFCRMWDFYLLSCEAGFRWGNLVVFHMQLAHNNHSVPLTRDYLYCNNDK